VRKIISILVALGLVLSLSVMVTPVSANVTTPAVSLSNYCACAGAGYNITFNTTASLTEGVHQVCIEFPAGTTVPATFATGKIIINTVPVFGSEVTVTGTKVCFLTPTDFPAGQIVVQFVPTAGLKNPCVAGPYQLKVSTSRAPDSTPVLSAKYTIIPATSSYEWLLDFSPTFAGINPAFVPPFKACGQNMTTTVYNSTIGGFVEPFNLEFTYVSPAGCAAPCTDVELYMALKAAPDGGTVHLEIDGTWFVLDEADLGDNITIEASLALAPDTDEVFPSFIHFDTVGAYEICFYALCPAGTPTCPACSSQATMIAQRCVDFQVYQQKDAFKMTLDEKWNLISLPLVPLGEDGSISIPDALASLSDAALDELVSIWYYNCATTDWAMYPGGGLTTLEDGKAYWMRFNYPLPACGNFTWWVFGTEKPEPPAAPSQYPVCEGWNMVGYTEVTSMAPVAYLWNWNAVPYPVVYGWTQGCWATVQGWDLINFTGGSLVPGQGYWVAFPAAGAVYVP
jgi:hypothetical protein